MSLIKEYLWKNKVITLIGIYFSTAIFLKIFMNIDFLIPCLWKSIFHFECLGCGLTTAFIHLIKLNFSAAFLANPFIFIVLPIGISYIYSDFRKFQRISKCEFSQGFIANV